MLQLMRQLVDDIYNIFKREMKGIMQTQQVTSTDYTKENVDKMQIMTANESSVSQASTQSHSHPQRRSYGNMIVLFENDRFFITLGPDYCCFMFAMIIFMLLYYFTIRQVYAKQGRQVLGAFTVFGALLQVLSYIVIAISNPGIITHADFDTEGEQEAGKIKRFCNQCNLPMLPRSRHCSICDVCVKGYDHHCPWTSKCIGQHNLYRFYFFASYTPLFLVYCIVLLSILAA